LISNRKKNTVRIGGGEWHSRHLSFPDAPGLRPTPDRVRQTVFNWLGQELHGLSCLDLFSGSAVMVEKSAAACQSLTQNKQLLKADAAQILNMDAVKFLAGNQQLFDLIFLDPPYNQGWLSKLLPQIGGHLAPDGLVYVEAELAMGDDDVWQVVKQGKAGNVHYHLIKSR
jgi:16S rRNA (guanine966-N2)-methyltransferase